MRIFRIRNYRLYFGGQLISQAGTWMQQIALSWLAYKLTNSPFMLAVVGMSSQLPSLLFMPLAGVIADRFNRHRIVICTQACALVQASILAYLTLTHQIQVWHLLTLGFAMGLINAFDMPVRSAFVIDLVKERESLPAAIAMNSSLFNITRLIGPALAGFLVESFGEGICFAINAASYIAVLAALLMMTGDFGIKVIKKSRPVFEEFLEGVHYVMGSSTIRAPILLLATFGFGGMAYILLMPVFVKSIGGGANTLGYLSSASAIGSVLGAAVLGTRKQVAGLGRWILISAFVYAIALCAFSFVTNLWAAIPILIVIGCAMMLLMGSCNTILQSVIDQDKRGRVMSLFTTAFMGTAPIGSLAAGAIASRFGFHTAVLACGIYCFCVAIAFATQLPSLRREGKHIYIERGLLEADEEIDILTKPEA